MSRREDELLQTIEVGGVLLGEGQPRDVLSEELHSSVRSRQAREAEIVVCDRLSLARPDVTDRSGDKIGAE